ncbi:MAG: type II toxin-antitoxin system VapC family toxin [Candidatus Omnitrophota bacterium]|nr:type II toxin-antitoxin system VapC family toxin [Candidatus Omnitrophota bacterium]
MLYFLDTSALVKRYRAETGTEIVDGLFQEAVNTLVISALSIAETARAVDTHVRRGEISVGDARLAIARLYTECHRGTLAVLEVQRRYIFRANELILQFHLTAADAIILATALTLAPETPLFVCADTRSGLLRVAEACGLSTLNPLSPSS